MTNEKIHFWQTPYIDLISEVPENWVVLILYTRPARIKAKVVAAVEVLCLLRDLNAKALIGGPLAEQSGVFWLTIPLSSLEMAIFRLPRLGYVFAVDLLESTESVKQNFYDYNISYKGTIHWKKKEYSLIRIYEEDSDSLRESAPDRRIFLLESMDGNVRSVRGYRGNSGPLSRRGLPVCDARMLVNLVSQSGKKLFLDPFAGVGGVILEAEKSEFSTISIDVDPSLRFGLSQLSSFHLIADASNLPFSEKLFDAIATEPPYDKRTGNMIALAFKESTRVLKDRGRLAILCSDWQAYELRQQANNLGLTPFLDSPINRKGLDVVVLAWQKNEKKSN